MINSLAVGFSNFMISFPSSQSTFLVVFRFCFRPDIYTSSPFSIVNPRFLKLLEINYNMLPIHSPLHKSDRGNSSHSLWLLRRFFLVVVSSSLSLAETCSGCAIVIGALISNAYRVSFLGESAPFAWTSTARLTLG
jgi:hypothetical protein